MTGVRIYQPARNTMQSGRANTRKWVLEYEPGAAKAADPLMGWIGSADTHQQIRMRFGSRDEAIAFAERHGLDYHVAAPRTPRLRKRNYADNFAFDKVR